MKITYDPEAQAVYIYLRDGQIVRNLRMTDDNGWTIAMSGTPLPKSDFTVDFDRDGNPLGIEILGVESAPVLVLGPVE